MEPAAYENYPLQIQGLLFIGLFVGVVSAEVLCSGRLSDRIMAILTKRNGNKRVPEMRLWLGYPAAVISAVGVLLWGLSVDNHWHWMVGQVAFFLCKSLNCAMITSCGSLYLSSLQKMLLGFKPVILWSHPTSSTTTPNTRMK